MKKHLLISMSCMFVLAAFTAAPASATKVKTGTGAAGAEVRASLSSPFASFTPASGTSAVTVECTGSTASGGWPPDTNNKSSAINTITQAGGSVADDLTAAGTPTFTGCTTAGAATTVTSNTTNGLWSVDWQVLNSAATPWYDFEIGIPKGAVVIVIVGTSCVITVSPNEATSITAYYVNGTGTTESKVYINEEIPFSITAGCEALGLKASESPAAFHATYELSAFTSTGGAAGGVIEEFS